MPDLHAGLDRALDRLLGPRCDVCGARVFPADRAAHREIEHAGESPGGRP